MQGSRLPVSAQTWKWVVVFFHLEPLSAARPLGDGGGKGPGEGLTRSKAIY